MLDAQIFRHVEALAPDLEFAGFERFTHDAAIQRFEILEFGF